MDAALDTQFRSVRRCLATVVLKVANQRHDAPASIRPSSTLLHSPLDLSLIWQASTIAAIRVAVLAGHSSNISIDSSRHERCGLLPYYQIAAEELFSSRPTVMNVIRTRKHMPFTPIVCEFDRYAAAIKY